MNLEQEWFDRRYAARIVSELEVEMKDDTLSNTYSNLKHNEHNEQFPTYFSKGVDTVFNAIPCNPFKIDSLCALSYTLNLFPESVNERLKEILSQEKHR